jgi:hypothetical protein
MSRGIAGYGIATPIPAGALGGSEDLPQGPGTYEYFDPEFEAAFIDSVFLVEVQKKVS